MAMLAPWSDPEMPNPNGALSTRPIGALDPRTMALLGAAQGFFQAGAPSRMPTGFGGAMASGMQGGLGGFQQAQQMQQAEAFRQQQLAMEQERLQMERDKHNRQRGTPLAYGPGTQLFHPGATEPFATVPFRTEVPAPSKPMTRTFKVGDQEVTQEYVDGNWREIGRGPAFAKSVPGAPVPEKPVPAPKPPTGYRWKEGKPGVEMEPVPGGPKDTAPKDAARAKGAVQKADIVIRKVDEALQRVSPWTTGLVGDLRSTTLGRITGSGAFDLEKTIDTIKANLGFSELQAMREASPTGGALGQVAVQELNMLQATVASLDKGQDAEIVKKNLQQVRQHFDNWKNAVLEAQKEQQPAQTNFPQPPAEAVRRLKMNPKEREQFEAIFGPGSAARVLGK